MNTELEEALQDSGSEHLSSCLSIFKYTVKYKRLDDKHVTDAHHKLLTNQVIKHLHISDEALRVNNTTFISEYDIEDTEELQELNIHEDYLAYGYCTRPPRASDEKETGRLPRSDEPWKSAVVSKTLDGKAKREWLRFRGLEDFSIEAEETDISKMIYKPARNQIARIQNPVPESKKARCRRLERRRLSQT